MTDAAEPEALRTVNLSKRFGPVEVLRSVSMTLRRGEVLGLIGDNGAGKSTLLKILTGVHAPDAGEVLLFGEPVTFRSPRDARKLGIEPVHQDLALVDELSVSQNMFLLREPVRRVLGIPFVRHGAMRDGATSHLADLGIRMPAVDPIVASLSGGQRQAIAFARALVGSARILLLDEPLSAMGAKEGALILKLIRDLKQRRDVSIIIIDHNYAHIFEICDRVNVVQHGQITFDRPTRETSIGEVTGLLAEEYRAAG